MHSSRRILGARFAAYSAATLTALAGTVFVAAPANALVTNWTSGGVTYRFDSLHPSNGAAVTAYTPVGSQSTVTIKDVMPVGKGKVPVRTINPSVFANENNLKTVVFVGSNLRTIDDNAFLQSNVSTVTLPNGLTTIGVNAFRNINLKKVVIPNNVTSIGAYAYYDGLVESVTIGNHVTSIGAGAFLANSNLRSVRFLGAAPTYIAPADGGTLQSFETETDVPLLVHYPAAQYMSFDYPTWQGYNTMPGLAPSIAGDESEGHQIYADHGSLIPAAPQGVGTSFTYQWYVENTAIPGATKVNLYVSGKYAGHRLRVIITSHSPSDYETKSTGLTGIISSTYKRLVVSATTIKKGQGLTVTCTGFTPGQNVKIYLDKKLRFTGKANGDGTVNRWVTFTSNTKSGKRTVRVAGLNASGVQTSTIETKVTYKK